MIQYGGGIALARTIHEEHKRPGQRHFERSEKSAFPETNQKQISRATRNDTVLAFVLLVNNAAEMQIREGHRIRTAKSHVGSNDSPHDRGVEQ